MSRTYRVRHLPQTPGSAHKYTDSDLTKRWLEHRVAHPRDWPRWEDARGGLSIAHFRCHPYVGFGVAGMHPKPHRIIGNRRIRRRLKLLMARWAELEDDFEERLPGRNDGWDRWVLC